MSPILPARSNKPSAQIVREECGSPVCLSNWFSLKSVIETIRCNLAILSKECPQIVKIAVNFDLNRLCHNKFLLRVVARRKSHHDQLAFARRVLQALQNIGNFALFRQKNF